MTRRLCSEFIDPLGIEAILANRLDFTFGLRHRWACFLRTLPNTAELLKPLERAINEVLIPAVTDHTVT